MKNNMIKKAISIGTIACMLFANTVGAYANTESLYEPETDITSIDIGEEGFFVGNDDGEESISSEGSDDFYLDDSDEEISAEGATSGTSGIFKYTLSDDGLRIRIDGFASGVTASNMNNLVIPETLEGKSVVSLAKNAFAFNENIQTVQVPYLSQGLGVGSFQQCPNLTSVTIGDGTEEIPMSCFNVCNALETVDIPDSVKTIGVWAFSSCSSIESFDFPDNLESIGQAAFSSCTSLTQLDLPNGLLSIGMNTFIGCTGITKLTIPDSVTSIGKGAFQDIPLTEITLPFVGEDSTYAGMGSDVFGYIFDYKLVSDSKQARAEAAVSGAIHQCTEYDSGTYKGYHYYIPTTLKKVTLTKATTIPTRAFINCSNIEEVIVPDTLTTIGAKAFQNCTKLKEFTFPDGIYSLGANAFDGCSAFTTITIPDGIHDIGQSAFPKNTNNIIIANKATVGYNVCAAENYKVYSTQSIGLDKNSATLYQNDTLQLQPTITMFNGNEDPDPNIVWTSSNENVVTVADGLITVVGPGNATVKAKSDDKEASCQVTVYFLLNGISIDQPDTEISVGEEKQLSVSYDPSNTTDDKTITWSSGDDTFVSVTTGGKIKGLKVGKTNITATDSKGHTDSIEITVIIPSESVTISENSIQIEKNAERVLTASMSPANSTDTITWSSSNDGIVSVDSKTGKITAKEVGKATITATTTSGKKSSCDVKVVISSTSISISDAISEIYAGNKLQLTSNILPVDTSDSVVWSSSDESVATVNETGLVSSIKAGKVIIYATTTNGIESSKELTILQPYHVEKIYVAKESIDMVKGRSVDLNCTITPANYTDDISYDISDESVISYANGTIKALNIGTATLTIISTNGVSEIVSVNVTQPSTAITLNKNEMNIQLNASERLIYSIEPNDSSDELVWTSTDSSIATVNDGLVKGVKAGKCEISVVTTSGKSATCRVTVIDPNSVSVNSISISQSELKINSAGAHDQLTYSISPSNYTDKISVSTSDSTVATAYTFLSNKINIDSVAVGVCDIIISASSGAEARCRIVVGDPLPVKTKEINLKKGQNASIDYSPAPSIENKIELVTTDSSIATVDGQGNVKAVNPGECDIKIKALTFEKLCHITVFDEKSALTEADVIEIIETDPASVVTLQANIDLKNTLLIKENSDITLDLNGHILYSDADDVEAIIQNKGKLRVIDSGENGVIRLGHTSAKNIGIDNQGELDFSGGKIYLASGNNISRGGFEFYGILNSGTLTFNDGSIYLSRRAQSGVAIIIVHGISNIENGTTFFKNGDIYINTKNSGIAAASECTTQSCGIYNNSTESVEVLGGKIMVFHDLSSLSVNGNTFIIAGLMNNGSGTIRVDGGDIYVSSDGDNSYIANTLLAGIANMESGIVSIDTGKIVSNLLTADYIKVLVNGIWNSAEGTVNIGTAATSTKDSVFIGSKMTNDSDVAVFSPESGNIRIEKGTFESGTILYSKKDIIIGKNDGVIDVKDLILYGRLASFVVKDATVYLYDGLITGTMSQCIIQCPDNYKLYTDSEGYSYLLYSPDPTKQQNKKTNEDSKSKAETKSSEEPSMGEKIRLETGDTYRVLSTENNPTVEFFCIGEKTKGKVKIPKEISINNVKYKVTSVAPNAFKDSSELKEITIPDTIEIIGANAFSGCKILTKVTIGKGVNNIEAKAFYNCKKLKTVNIKTKKLKSVGSKAFKRIAKKAKIMVPKANKKKYVKLLKKRIDKTTKIK